MDARENDATTWPDAREDVQFRHELCAVLRDLAAHHPDIEDAAAEMPLHAERMREINLHFDEARTTLVALKLWPWNASGEPTAESLPTATHDILAAVARAASPWYVAALGGAAILAARDGKTEDLLRAEIGFANAAATLLRDNLAEVRTWLTPLGMWPWTTTESGD